MRIPDAAAGRRTFGMLNVRCARLLALRLTFGIHVMRNVRRLASGSAVRTFRIHVMRNVRRLASGSAVRTFRSLASRRYAAPLPACSASEPFAGSPPGSAS